MAKTPGRFRAALLIGWIVLGAAGVAFARWKGIPNWGALPIIAAFLVAFPFYLVAGFPVVRERVAPASPPVRFLVFLLASSILPYLVSCLGAVKFHWLGLAMMTGLPLVFGLWYFALPARLVTDLLFLALIPAVLLGKYFDVVFPTADPSWRKYAVVLGHVILIELAVMVLVVARRMGDFGYGFWPNAKEWRVGGLHYLYFVVIAAPLAALLKAVQFSPQGPAWLAIGYFLGSLWVVSLSEEFFLRGVLWRVIEERSSRVGALAVTSIVFGLVHIGFRGFPNWRWVLIATVLGFACGRARMVAGSIRAGVVTHTLVVTTWQAFFR